MTVLDKFLYLLRKHSSLRFALFAFVLLVSTLISLAVTFASKKEPTLTHISPQIALPGDTIYVYGATDATIGTYAFYEAKRLTTLYIYNCYFRHFFSLYSFKFIKRVFI